jgi:hypothetical protein
MTHCFLLLCLPKVRVKWCAVVRPICALSDFELFTVNFQTTMLVKLVSCGEPPPLTCLLFGTGHFL